MYDHQKKVKNFDLTDFIKGHGEYTKQFEKIIIQIDFDNDLHAIYKQNDFLIEFTCKLQYIMIYIILYFYLKTIFRKKELIILLFHCIF